MRPSFAITVLVAWLSLVFDQHLFAETPPAPMKSLADETEEPQNILVESVGLFGGIQLYNSYLNIGMLADSMAAGLYEPTEVYQLLGSVLQPLERVDKQLDKLANLNLTKDDIEALKRMKKIATLLREQGQELELFWDKGLDENGKKYDAARQAAWKELDDLLELEPKNEVLPPPREKVSKPK